MNEDIKANIHEEHSEMSISVNFILNIKDNIFRKKRLSKLKDFLYNIDRRVFILNVRIFQDSLKKKHLIFFFIFDVTNIYIENKCFAI